MVKRHFGTTCEEWLSAAEHVINAGSEKIIMCARGIVAPKGDLRYTPDTGIIPFVQKETHAPVFFDPSHAVGIREFVAPTALAAIVEGAQGIMVDVHPNSAEALCDGAQALNPQDFRSLVLKVHRLRDAIAVPPEIELGVLDISLWPLSPTGVRQKVEFLGALKTVTLTRVEITRRNDLAFPGYDVTAMSPTGPVIGYFKESGEGWIRNGEKMGLY